MESPLKPYEGAEPYVFVSYSHKDSEKVFAILQRLQSEGLRIWYDKGIEWGSEWPDYIAEHIHNCRCFMTFHSINSKNSRNCKQEIYFAVKHEKDILSIYLEEVKLNPGIEMQLAPFQATYFYQYPADKMEDFYSMFLHSGFLKPCYNKLESNIDSLSLFKEKVVPIIFIVDTSGSMFASIKILNNVLQQTIDCLRGHIKETTFKTLLDYDGGKFVTYEYEIAIITFGFDAKLLINYTNVKNIKALPEIEANGTTAFGAALSLAKNIIENSTITLENWFNPKVILITDGYPTDDYQKTLNEFISTGRSAKCARYAIGLGKDFDKDILKQFSSWLMEIEDASGIAAGFQKITNDILTNFN